MADGLTFDEYPGLLAESSTSEFREAFFQLGSRLHKFEAAVLKPDAKEYSARQLVLAGILGHSFECFHLLFLSWQHENFAGVAASLRMLIEISATNFFFVKSPSRMDSAYNDQLPNVGKIMAVGIKRYPELKRFYEKYSSVVHPRKGSYRLQLVALDPERHHVTGMFLELGVFEKHQCIKSIKFVFEILMSSFIELIEDPSIFVYGETLVSGRAVKPNFSCIHWEPKE